MHLPNQKQSALTDVSDPRLLPQRETESLEVVTEGTVCALKNMEITSSFPPLFT